MISLVQGIGAVKNGKQQEKTMPMVGKKKFAYSKAGKKAAKKYAKKKKKKVKSKYQEQLTELAGCVGG